LLVEKVVQSSLKLLDDALEKNVQSSNEAARSVIPRTADPVLTRARIPEQRCRRALLRALGSGPIVGR
jgi:hypothetical protein